MKKQLILFAILLMAGIATHAQLGIGTNTPDASSALDVESTTKGLLPPRMTEAQRNDIASPAEGLVVYNTTEKCLNYWNASSWVSICKGETGDETGGETDPPAAFVCGDTANGNVTFTYNGAEVTYGTIQSATGKCWLDRNLGASRAATAYNDYKAYGDLFQWGRGADGHQLINWTGPTTGTPVNGTTTTLSGSDTPGHNKFILTSSDWRSPQNANLWQGVNGINNPCPSGFRIPVISELTAEIAQYHITNNATAYTSPLKFTIPGYRYNNGAIHITQGSVYYWSSSVKGSSTYIQYISNELVSHSDRNRVFGFSVRCVKD